MRQTETAVAPKSARISIGPEVRPDVAAVASSSSSSPHVRRRTVVAEAEIRVRACVGMGAGLLTGWNLGEVAPEAPEVLRLDGTEAASTVDLRELTEEIGCELFCFACAWSVLRFRYGYGAESFAQRFGVQLL